MKMKKKEELELGSGKHESSRGSRFTGGFSNAICCSTDILRTVTFIGR